MNMIKSNEHYLILDEKMKFVTIVKKGVIFLFPLKQKALNILKSQLENMDDYTHTVCTHASSRSKTHVNVSTKQLYLIIIQIIKFTIKQHKKLKSWVKKILKCAGLMYVAHIKKLKTAGMFAEGSLNLPQ